MEQSTDGTPFPLWRALALGGFAAAAFTAVALLGSPSSAHADDGADPSLLGAVTEVVESLDQPIDAVVTVVDVVDTSVVEPVVDVVDDTVAAVPVVNTVVEETVGAEPVATIVEPVVQTVEDTVSGLGDVVTAVPVPSVPVVVPTVPVPASPDPAVPAHEQAGDTSVVPPSAVVPAQASARIARALPSRLRPTPSCRAPRRFPRHPAVCRPCRPSTTAGRSH
jgi:hypothetical protein